jgi:hypothetical protein
MRKPFVVLRSVMGIAALAACLMSLASCQSVKFAPKPASASSAMLVVPLEFKNQSSRDTRLLLDLKYDGSLDSKTGNLIDFHNDYGFITEVAAGSHRITRMLVRWEATGQILRQWDLDIPFKLSQGQFTILPVRFSVTLKENATYFANYNLLPDQIAEVRADLNKYRNMESWTEAPEETAK